MLIKVLAGTVTVFLVLVWLFGLFLYIGSSLIYMVSEGVVSVPLYEVPWIVLKALVTGWLELPNWLGRILAIISALLGYQWIGSVIDKKVERMQLWIGKFLI